MQVKLAQRVSKNIFTYQLIGFSSFFLYDATNGSMILSDSLTGAPLFIKATEEYIDYETFILVARNMYLDMVEAKHCMNSELSIN